MIQLLDKKIRKKKIKTKKMKGKKYNIIKGGASFKDLPLFRLKPKRELLLKNENIKKFKKKFYERIPGTSHYKNIGNLNSKFKKRDKVSIEVNNFYYIENPKDLGIDKSTYKYIYLFQNPDDYQFYIYAESTFFRLIATDNPNKYSFDFAARNGEISLPQEYTKMITNKQEETRFNGIFGKIILKIRTSYNTITLKTK